MRLLISSDEIQPSLDLVDLELFYKDTDWLLNRLKMHLFIIKTKTSFNTYLQKEINYTIIFK